MGIDVRRGILVDAECAAVAAFAMDPANDTEWIGGIREVVPATAGPLAVGSQVERVASFMGREMRYTLEVVEMEVGRKLRMESTEAPFPMKVTYSFEPRGGKTAAEVRVQGGPGGLMGMMGPVMSWQVGRNLAGDVKRLKAIFEAETLANQILHITTQEAWAPGGDTYTPARFEADGFIHCSAAHQVLGPANALYHGQQGLVLLCIDRSRVTARVVDEAADSNGQVFPHIYGPLNQDAVVAVVPFPPGADGSFSLPAALSR